MDMGTKSLSQRQKPDLDLSAPSWFAWRPLLPRRCLHMEDNFPSQFSLSPPGLDMTTFLRDLPNWFPKNWELFTLFDHISASRDNPVQTALLGFSLFLSSLRPIPSTP